MFPEFLFQLSARDQQVSWLDPVANVISVSQTAVELTATYTVPNDRVLLLEYVTAFLRPFSTQNIAIDTGIFVAPPLAAVSGTIVLRWLTQRTVALGAGVRDFQFADPHIIVPASWRVMCKASFNAGASLNDLVFSVFGTLIPLGNIQRI